MIFAFKKLLRNTGTYPSPAVIRNSAEISWQQQLKKVIVPWPRKSLAPKPLVEPQYVHLA